MSVELDDKTLLGCFETAFSGRTSGPVRTCACGVTYYDDHNSYDWETGEFEQLTTDSKAIALPYAVGSVEFEGGFYVTDCTCWHPRALKIAKYLRGNDAEIAEFLTLVKARLMEAAKGAAVVVEPVDIRAAIAAVRAVR